MEFLGEQVSDIQDIEVAETGETGPTMPEGQKTILGPGVAIVDGAVIDVEQEKERTKEVKDPFAGEMVQTTYTDPATGETEVEVDEGGLVDFTIDLLTTTPTGKVVGVGLGTAIAGSAVGHMLPTMSRKVAKEIATDVVNNPDKMTNILEAIKMAKERNIAITPEMATGEGGMYISGNAWLDKQLGKIYKDFTVEEYGMVNSIIDQISKTPKRSIDEIVDTFQEQLKISYKKHEGIEEVAWSKFDDALEAETTTGTGRQYVYKTQELFNALDDSLEDADQLVINFLKTTLLRSPVKGQMTSMSIKSEVDTLVTEIASFPKPSKRTKAQKNRVRYLRKKIDDLNVQRASLEVDLRNAPSTLTMEQLITASKMLSNKMYVKGGNISTNNLLEKHHLIKTKKIVDDYIAQNLSPETKVLLDNAKSASRKKFDTFGYALKGRNRGVATDVNGNIITAHEAEALTLAKSEIFNSDPAKALIKFKTYEQHIDKNLLDEVKLEYLENVFGFSKAALTKEGKFIVQELDDATFSSAMKNMLETKAGRNLTKYIVGEDNFKSLIAIKELNKALKTKIPNGDYGIFKQWGQAYKDAGNPLTGSLLMALKIAKTLSYDIITYPYKHAQAHKFNKEFINKLTRELNKGKKTDPGMIQKLINDWDERIQSGGYTQAEMADAAGGGYIKYEPKPGSPGVHREKKLTTDFKEATNVSISPEGQKYLDNKDIKKQTKD